MMSVSCCADERILSPRGTSRRGISVIITQHPRPLSAQLSSARDRSEPLAWTPVARSVWLGFLKWRPGSLKGVASARPAPVANLIASDARDETTSVMRPHMHLLRHCFSGGGAFIHCCLLHGPLSSRHSTRTSASLDTSCLLSEMRVAFQSVLTSAPSPSRR